MSTSYMRKCAGKKRFESRADAGQSRAGLTASKDFRQGAVHTYRCDQCLGWHNGNSGFTSHKRRRPHKRPNKRMRGRV